MDLFQKLLKQSGLPVPETEYRFCDARRWRFDYAWPEQKIAVEQEGGAWSYGRHNRGSGFIKDCEKYNNAVLSGWRVLRYAPEQMTNGAIEDLKTMLGRGTDD